MADAAWEEVEKSMHVEANRLASFNDFWPFSKRRKCNPSKVRKRSASAQQYTYTLSLSLSLSLSYRLTIPIESLYIEGG
jgi:hypothetical protein